MQKVDMQALRDNYLNHLLDLDSWEVNIIYEDYKTLYKLYNKHLIIGPFEVIHKKPVFKKEDIDIKCASTYHHLWPLSEVDIFAQAVVDKLLAEKTLIPDILKKMSLTLLEGA